MTRRRRARVISRYAAADFMTSDGWSYWILDAHPLLPSLAAAEAAWEVARAETWQLWAADPSPFPPVAAQRLDGITHDPESVAEFRVRRPQAAAAIAAELDLYVAALARRRDEVAARVRERSERAAGC